ncbi:MAG TPA: biopolymer transporter ExbD, partial [Archangium sp.]|nr:biopolymer transporter ExbD [Archangium sp.]
MAGGAQDNDEEITGINVTPLVDVVLVLLIIFMVVTPVLNRVIAVQLPEPPAPLSTPPASPEKQWVVAVTSEGTLTLNDEPVADADYVPRLKQALAGRSGDGRSVVFKADDRAPYGRLVKALDG